MSNEFRLDKKRAVLLLFAISISCLSGWLGQPLIHANKDASDVIVNVFSILAGFLVTIMTIMGDPLAFRGKTWRSDAIKRTNVYQRLVRHKWLFIIYLLVLGIIFVANLIAKTYPVCNGLRWLEAAYLSLATFAFILSLTLPGRLMSLQMDRFDEMVESRRKGREESGGE